MQTVGALAVELIRWDTQNPPGNEQGLAEHIGARLQRAGGAAEVQILESGRANVIVTFDWGPGPHLLLVGHLDTVPVGSPEEWSVAPLQGVVENTLLIGRGAADMKGALAAMVLATEELAAHHAGLRGRLSLVGLCDEEFAHAGARHAVAEGLDANWAIVGEPTNLLPVIASKGNALIRVEILGQTAHSSTPDEGMSAISALVPVLAALDAHAQRLRCRDHELTGPPTLCVGEVHGGDSPWSVAARCELSIDRRLVPGEVLDDAVDEISQAVARALAGLHGAYRSAVTLMRSIPAVEVSPDAPVTKAVVKSVSAVTGRAVRGVGWSASSDASILAGIGGIPTVLCGPGDLAGQAHRPDESVQLGDLDRAIRIYCGAAQLLLGGDG